MGEGSPRATRNALTLVLAFGALAGMIALAWREQERLSAPAAPGAVGVPAEPEVAAAPAMETPAAAPPDGPEIAAAPPKAAAEPAVAVEPTATAAPEATVTTGAKPPVAAPAEAPGLDVVRVEPDGSAAVAGTAAPGAKVTIFADQAPLAEAEADASGNFVAVFKVPPSDAPRALTLGAVPAGGGEAATSDDVVMLLPKAPETPPVTVPAAVVPASAPPKGSEPAVAKVARQRAGGPMPRPTAATGPAESAGAPVALASGAAGTAAPEVAVTAIVRSDAVEVLPAGGKNATLTLASISYSGSGGVTLAGVGAAGSALRAYVDGRFAQDARVGADGRWSMDLGGVAEGLYTLRIDQIGADGKVAKRVETPFQRDYPHAPPPRPGQPAAPVGTVTVQPGNNLWTLARERYGSGVMYTQIFTANREQIRNPDLIYPGQIFNVPDGAPAAVE